MTPRLPAILLVLAACGGGSTPESASIAKALSYDSEKKAAIVAAEAKAQAEFAAKKKAEAEATAALDREIDAVAIVPPDAAKDLAGACQAMIDAYDRFMRDQKSDEAVFSWVNEQRGKTLALKRTNCESARSVELAACIAHALGHPPAELQSKGQDGAARLMDRCMAKYGRPEAPPTTPPPG